MIYGLDDLRVETSYWYNDVDLEKLQKKYGEDRFERLLFHMVAFEANKLLSFAPREFDLGPYVRFHTHAFESLWRKIAHRVWAQWRYENDRPYYSGPSFTSRPMENTFDPIQAPQGPCEVLSFCGGGKDSLVAMKLLERADAPYSTFAYAHSIYGRSQPQHQLIDQLIDFGKPQIRHRMSVFDSIADAPVQQVLSKYGVKGLHAAETPSSIFAALPLVLQHGYSYIALAHERSANVGNLIWEKTGEDVNHQWGKSRAAESLLNEYLQRELIANMSYFSLLQPVYDVLIFNLLKRDLQAVPFTHSCNVRKPWCGRCPKCAYVWLNYLAHLPLEQLNQSFGEDILNAEENQHSYRQMMGLAEHTPFECIGQIPEVRLAVALCKKKGITAKALDFQLESEGLDWIDGILSSYLRIDLSYIMPSHIAEGVLPQMEAAAVEAKAAIHGLITN